MFIKFIFFSKGYAGWIVFKFVLVNLKWGKHSTSEIFLFLGVPYFLNLYCIIPLIDLEICINASFFFANKVFDKSHLSELCVTVLFSPASSLWMISGCVCCAREAQQAWERKTFQRWRTRIYTPQSRPYYLIGWNVNTACGSTVFTHNLIWF